MSGKMSVSRLGSRGRVTIPKRIREILDLKSGDFVRFEEHKGDILLVPVRPSLRDYIGSVEPRERPEDLNKARRETKRRRADEDATE